MALGIIDVALGVAGFAPLDDQRGRPDADGRIMHATVVAVADEICFCRRAGGGQDRAASRWCWSAARICRRGAGLGDRADVVMPRDFDLFRRLH